MAMLDPRLAHALSDAQDRLLSAQEPLAGLQLRCGGEIPGEIAVPALRELVTKARRFGLRLARPFLAHDGADHIRAWVEISPVDGGAGGCAIVLRNWHASALPPEDDDAVQARRREIARAFAELTADLDSHQCVLAVTHSAVDLADLASAMRAGLGRMWSDFVILPGGLVPDAADWRALDGVKVNAAGSDRLWRASLVPQAWQGGVPTGFALCLTADVPLPAHPLPSLDQPASRVDPVVGREVAPALRQPISRIIAQAETIRLRMAGPLQEEYSRYAADIATAGQHLLELVEDLADLEVIEAAGFTTAADHVDLGDIARRAGGILSMRARDKGITLILPGADVHIPAIAEFRRVLQVLLNLIGNAIRYSPEGSSVEVRVERDTAMDTTMARALVIDQGPGLDAAEQARLFAKFERLGRAGDGGSGLGLYISRRLARAMGGELAVKSAKGEGARFILTVPGGGGRW